jgi:hypothetical protein
MDYFHADLELSKIEKQIAPIDFQKIALIFAHHDLYERLYDVLTKSSKPYAYVFLAGILQNTELKNKLEKHKRENYDTLPRRILKYLIQEQDNYCTHHEEFSTIIHCLGVLGSLFETFCEIYPSKIEALSEYNQFIDKLIRLSRVYPDEIYGSVMYESYLSYLLDNGMLHEFFRRLKNDNDVIKIDDGSEFTDIIMGFDDTNPEVLEKIIAELHTEDTAYLKLLLELVCFSSSELLLPIMFQLLVHNDAVVVDRAESYRRLHGERVFTICPAGLRGKPL